MEKNHILLLSQIISAQGLGFFSLTLWHHVMALYFWFQLKFSASKCDFPVIFCIHLCYKKSGSEESESQKKKG